MQSYAGSARPQRNGGARITRSRAQTAAIAVASTLPFVALALATLDSAALYVVGKMLAGLGAR